MTEAHKLSMPPIKWNLDQTPIQLHLHEIEEQLAELKRTQKLHPDFIPLIARVALTRIMQTDKREVIQPKLMQALRGELPDMQVLHQDTTTALELLQQRVNLRRK